MVAHSNVIAWIQELVSVYYGMVEELDAQIGAILRELRDSGMDKKTIIIFTSDHG